MANLRLINGTYHVRFRWGTGDFTRSLDTEDFTDADARRKRIEAFLHDLRTGRRPLPPEGADIGLYILSDGKMDQKLSLQESPASVTLGDFWEQYRADLPAGAKEDSSLLTEEGHFKHLLNILGKDTAVVGLTTADLQGYVSKRSKQKGFRGHVFARTIKKEIATFRAVWNSFGMTQEIVDEEFRAHFGKLIYPKERSRPAFKTWSQIEHQIARGHLDEDKQVELWDCLFLSLDEIDELLDFVKERNLVPWLYPMFMFCAHTGARRSEILNSEIDDFDFESGTVQVREKKRDKSKDFTFRPVCLSSVLSGVMSAWFGRHPGGRFTICDPGRRQITRNVASHYFERVLEGSKWSVVRGWHVFRHSLASNLAAKGIDQRTIDATLGHSTEEMRRRYRHLFPGQQKAALASVFERQ